MTTPRHLEKAPITEALVDIRVKLPPSVDLSTLESAHVLFSEGYPQRRERIRMETNIDPKRGESQTKSFVDGFMYTSTNNKQVVQVRLDGFTFSRLKPYDAWESLRTEAYRLWGLYRGKASPELITRVALRYINRLEIPLPIQELGDYLTAPPTVPRNLPQEFISFLARNVIRDKSLEVTAIITQWFEPVSSSEFASILLDIDVFKEANFNVDADDAWETVDKLRDLKNKIFFESITEKTIELCK